MLKVKKKFEQKFKQKLNTYFCICMFTSSRQRVPIRLVDERLNLTLALGKLSDVFVFRRARHSPDSRIEADLGQISFAHGNEQNAGKRLVQ